MIQPKKQPTQNQIQNDKDQATKTATKKRPVKRKKKKKPVLIIDPLNKTRAGPKEKYNKLIHPLMFGGFMAHGDNEEEAAIRGGIAYSTFKEWKKKYPELGDAIEINKAKFLASGLKKAENKLEKMFDSHIIKLKKLTVYTDETGKPIIRRDDKGNVVKYANKVEYMDHYVPPNFHAILLYLRTRGGDKYNEKHQIDDSSELKESINEMMLLFENEKK